MKYKIQLTVFCCLGFFGCGGTDSDKASEILRPVKSIVVGDTGLLAQRIFSGELRSELESNLSFKVSGTVKKVNVEIGDSVEKGKVIAELEATPYELPVQKAKAGLSKARANLKNQNSNFKRIKSLYEGDNVSRTELDNARAQLDSARADLKTFKKALEIAELELSYTRVESPGRCLIASSEIEEGENIQAGRTAFFVTCGGSLEVQMALPESVISKVKKGMPVDVTFPSVPDRKFEGQVREVGKAIRKGESTFPVSVRILDNASELKAGLSAKVEFRINEQVEVVNKFVVPVSSVGEDKLGRFVFTLETEKEDKAVVKRRSVKIGRIDSRGIEILEGVSAGERVVVAGVSVLKEGMKVKF